MERISITRELLLELGVSPKSISEKIKEMEIKSVTHVRLCLKINNLTKCSICSDCPSTAQHGSMQETS